jgi:hypothetical protein
MDSVDYCCAEHTAALSKILDLLESPRHCAMTGRTKGALIKVRLSSGQLFDAARTHIAAKLPLYCQMQTMYDEEPTLGYVICPLLVDGHRFFCKVFFLKVQRECDERLVISAHEPEFPCPGEKKK